MVEWTRPVLLVPPSVNRIQMKLQFEYGMLNETFFHFPKGARMKLTDARCRVKQEVCHPIKFATFLELLRCIAVALCVTNGMPLAAGAESREIRITQPYLNIPINREAKERIVDITTKGEVKRQFPSQLADDSIDYWIYLDVSEFEGKTITISGAATQRALNRIYKSRRINGSNSLYRDRTAAISFHRRSRLEQ